MGAQPRAVPRPAPECSLGALRRTPHPAQLSPPRAPPASSRGTLPRSPPSRAQPHGGGPGPRGPPHPASPEEHRQVRGLPWPRLPAAAPWLGTAAPPLKEQSAVCTWVAPEGQASGLCTGCCSMPALLSSPAGALGHSPGPGGDQGRGRRGPEQGRRGDSEREGRVVLDGEKAQKSLTVQWKWGCQGGLAVQSL